MERLKIERSFWRFSHEVGMFLNIVFGFEIKKF